MIGKLGLNVPSKFNAHVQHVTQKAEDFMSTGELLKLLSQNKEKILNWLETEGIDLAVEALTQDRCDLLAEYIHMMLPLPIRMVVKQALIAKTVWENVSLIIEFLQE